MSPQANKQPTAYSFKVVLLGEGCVGKTSIVLRYVEDKFNPQHISTLQASFLNKKVTLEDGNKAQLNIWDTAGQERFHALGPIYYRGSHGAILVYDITDQDSFQKVKNWVKELKRMLGADIVIMIVGNKTDLEAQRTVPNDEALQYAESVQAQYCETSAKNNEGIEELFLGLTILMTRRHNEQKEQGDHSLRLMQGNVGSRRAANQLIVEDDSQDGGDDDDVGGNRERAETNRSCCSTG